MKNFTKMFVALALCMLGVASANAKVEQVHATFENPSNTNTTWNAETRTFTWSTTYYNQLRKIGLPNGDISKYKKLVVDCKIKSGERFRVLFYQGDANLTLYAQDGINEYIIADTLKAIAPDTYNGFIKNCSEICLSGNNTVAPGEAVINDVYLETYNDEGEKVYATFENPSNTNTTWNAETKTFTWSTTYYNQLRKIGLPNGDISKYKKLVVDCKIKSGERFRVLFYQGDANLTLYAQDGINEYIIADTLKAIAPDTYNGFIKNCSEICLSGNNTVAPGEAVINSVYLETYPENESVDIPDVVEEEDPGRPEGNFIDLTADMYANAAATYEVGKKYGKGNVIYGSKDIAGYADLAGYSKLTIVATPGIVLNINLNHEVEIKNSDADYDEADADKFDWVNAQTDENGLYELDLTQFTQRHLNCIWTSWAFEKLGTVWYLLLTKDTSTGIRSVETSTVKGESVMFDLQGRRVSQPQKGLYIVNGKKVVF